MIRKCHQHRVFEQRLFFTSINIYLRRFRKAMKHIEILIEQFWVSDIQKQSNLQRCRLQTSCLKFVRKLKIDQKWMSAVDILDRL